MNIFGDKTIKSGDLAIVVRDCCGKWLGTPLKVAAVSFASHPSHVRCETCGRQYSNIDYVIAESPQRIWHAPLFFLKKIDPLAEHETERHDETIEA